MDRIVTRNSIFVMDNPLANCFDESLKRSKLFQNMSKSSFKPMPTRQLSSFGLALMTLAASHSSMAQYGAAPSSTGMFFNDLRARVYQKDQQAGVQSGERVYDYSRGVYMGSPEESRPMGQEPAFASNEAVRQMGQPAVRSGFGSTSPRGAGDYTQYSGPYPQVSTFFAPTYVSDPFLGGQRNIKAGPVNIGFGLTGVLEYNDNLTRASASEDPVSDFIGSAFLNINANYQITQNNALSFTTTLGFDHYFEHPELSPYGNEFVLNVLPGSTLAFDMKVGPVDIVFYDRMSVRPAVQNDFAIDPTEIFGVFQNDAGVAASWAINSKLNLALNFMRSDARALEEESEIYNRTTHSLQGSLAWSPYQTWSVGLEGGMTWVQYPENFNNDGTLANAGVFFMTPIGKSTFIRIAAGIQSFDFEDPPEFDRTVTDGDIARTQNAVAGTNAQIAALDQQIARNQDPTLTPGLIEERTRLAQQATDLSALLGQQQTAKVNEDNEFASNNRDSSDLNDFYYNVTLTNQLNSRISQTLSFGHESSLNVNTNYITADYVTYGLGIIAWRGSRISVSGYFEDADESGGSTQEDITQAGFDAYISHQLSSRVRIGAGYHYGNSQSSLENRDFVQHAFNADLNFAVNRKLSMAVGWRYWTTEADLEDDNFEQNRFLVQVSYNFGP